MLYGVVWSCMSSGFSDLYYVPSLPSHILKEVQEWSSFFYAMIFLRLKELSDKYLGALGFI
jgi:hypothetical protein